MTRLAEIEARLKAATGGEWIQIEAVDGPTRFIATSEQLTDGSGHIVQCRSLQDADLIAHCGGDSGDVAWLIAENKRKDELVKTLAAGVRAECCCERSWHEAPNCERGLALRAAEKAGV